MEKIWDYTSLNTFLQCRKKYYYWGVRHLQSLSTAPALEFGKAVHDALDVYYGETNQADGLAKALAIFRATYQDRDGEILRTVANGEKMLKWYAIVYKDEPFVPLGKPEIGFVFPIGDILWGGRMDLPVLWQGDLYIMEHKTTGAIRANYFRQFNPNMQISSYIAAAQEYLGRDCLGCIVNAMEPWNEPKRTTPKTKRPEEHFVRDPITRTKEQLSDFKTDVQRIVRDIGECHKKGEWYPNQSQCFSYNYACPYRELCMYGEDERTIARNFRHEAWEPYKQLLEVKSEEPN